ncbi:hypothetical protein [Shewanella atlantica]|uniref:hypothetical protein n=1 Tax=Shewanella atlantica TaxID=271099 RepID=UPI00163B193A|nr:hypothetical protein [Shewanella atlantica]
MRHSKRQKHLKQLHRSAHIRRMCYFRTAQSGNTLNAPSQSMYSDDKTTQHNETSHKK